MLVAASHASVWKQDLSVGTLLLLQNWNYITGYLFIAAMVCNGCSSMCKLAVHSSEVRLNGSLGFLVHCINETTFLEKLII